MLSWMDLGGDGRLGLLRYNFVDRRVILDYVKRDAAHFCRYLRDPRLRKKRRGAFLSLFTVLQSIMTEISAIFVVIYATFASMTRDARHFCRYLRDSSLRKKRHASHLSLFTILYHINAELIVTFVVIYECLATLSREALEFCRQARDSRLRKKRHGSFLSLFA